MEIMLKSKLFLPMKANACLIQQNHLFGL